MILAKKIQCLRKNFGYTQEMLAEKCGVSRQAISKWEADIALPETDNLILLSKLFRVTIDVLLKDELELNEMKEVHTCGIQKQEEPQDILYQGLIIKESIKDELILDYIAIEKVELWKTDWKPKYWTALYFTSKQIDFPVLLSKAFVSSEEYGNWFVDMKKDNIKIIVFKDKVLQYEIGNAEEKEKVCQECRRLGIPDKQMDWEE
ncbi:MAG: helix-turn-helix domain-containing protein [Mobilitalea sp.]